MKISEEIATVTNQGKTNWMIIDEVFNDRIDDLSDPPAGFSGDLEI